LPLRRNPRTTTTNPDHTDTGFPEPHYLTTKLAERYRVVPHNDKLYSAHTGKPVHTPDHPATKWPTRTRGHLLVSDGNGNHYIAPDLGWVRTHQAFDKLGVHVAATIEVHRGVIEYVTDHSGLYDSDRTRVTDLLDKDLASVERTENFRHLDYAGRPVSDEPPAATRNTATNETGTPTTQSNSHDTPPTDPIRTTSTTDNPATDETGTPTTQSDDRDTPTTDPTGIANTTDAAISTHDTRTDSSNTDNRTGIEQTTENEAPTSTPNTAADETDMPTTEYDEHDTPTTDPTRIAGTTDAAISTHDTRTDSSNTDNRTGIEQTTENEPPAATRNTITDETNTPSTQSDDHDTPTTDPTKTASTTDAAISTQDTRADSSDTGDKDAGQTGEMDPREAALRARLADEATTDARVVAARRQLERAQENLDASRTEFAAAETRRDQRRSDQPNANDQARHTEAETAPADTRADSDEHTTQDPATAQARRALDDARAAVDSARAEHEAAVQHAVQERYEALRAESEARIAAAEQDAVRMRAATEERIDTARDNLHAAAEGVKDARATHETAKAELEAGLKGKLDETIEASQREVESARKALQDSRDRYEQARGGNEPRQAYLERLHAEVGQRQKNLKNALVEHEALLRAADDRTGKLEQARTERKTVAPGRRARWKVTQRSRAWRKALSESDAAVRSRVRDLHDELRDREAAYSRAEGEFKSVMRGVIKERLAGVGKAKTPDRDAYEAGLADRRAAMRAASRKALEAADAVQKAAFVYRDEVLRETTETDPAIGRGATDHEVDRMVRDGSPEERAAAMPEWMTRRDPHPDPEKRRTPRETQMLAYVLTEFGPADMKGGEGKTLQMVMDGYRTARVHGVAHMLTSSDPLVVDMIDEVGHYVGTHHADAGVDLVKLPENDPFPQSGWKALDEGRNLLVVGTKDGVLFAGLRESDAMVTAIKDKGAPADEVGELRAWVRTQPHVNELEQRLNAVAEKYGVRDEHGAPRQFRPIPEGVGSFDEVDTVFDGNQQAILSPGAREDADPATVAHLRNIYDNFRIAVLEHGLADKDFGRPDNTRGLWHSQMSREAIDKLTAATGDRESVLAEMKHYTQFALTRWGLRRDTDFNTSRAYDKVMLINSKTTDKLSWDRDKSTETRLQELGRYLDVVQGVTVRGDNPADSLTMQLNQWIGSRFLKNPKGVSGTAKEVEDAIYDGWGGAHDTRGDYFGVPEIPRYYDSKLLMQERAEFDNRETKLQGMAADVVDNTKISFTVRDNTIVGIEQNGRPQWNIMLDNGDIRGAGERVTEMVVDAPGGGRTVEETRTTLNHWHEKQAHERGITDWVDAIVDQRMKQHAQENGLTIADGVKLDYAAIDARWHEEHGGGDTAERAAADLVATFGKPGAIMFINKSGARGTDPKPTDEAKDLGGVLTNISGGPAFSVRVLLQAIWRSARGGSGEDRVNGGTPGSAKMYVSPEDYHTEIEDAQATREITQYLNAVHERDQAATAYESSPSHEAKDALDEADERVTQAVRVLREETTPRLQRRAEEQLLAPHRKNNSNPAPILGAQTPSTLGVTAPQPTSTDTSTLATSQLPTWLSTDQARVGTHLQFTDGELATTVLLTGHGTVSVHDTNSKGEVSPHPSTTHDHLLNLIDNRRIESVTVIPAEHSTDSHAEPADSTDHATHDDDTHGELIRNLTKDELTHWLSGKEDPTGSMLSFSNHTSYTTAEFTSQDNAVVRETTDGVEGPQRHLTRDELRKLAEDSNIHSAILMPAEPWERALTEPQSDPVTDDATPTHHDRAPPQQNPVTRSGDPTTVDTRARTLQRVAAAEDLAAQERRAQITRIDESRKRVAAVAEALRNATSEHPDSTTQRDDVTAARTAYEGATSEHLATAANVVDELVAAIRTAGSQRWEAYQAGQISRDETFEPLAHELEHAAKAAANAFLEYYELLAGPGKPQEKSGPLTELPDAELEKAITNSSRARADAAEKRAGYAALTELNRRVTGKVPRFTQIMADLLLEHVSAEVSTGEGKEMIAVLRSVRTALDKGLAYFTTSSDPLVKHIEKEFLKLIGGRSFNIKTYHLKQDEKFPEAVDGEPMIVIGTEANYGFRASEVAKSMLDDLDNAGVPEEYLADLRRDLDNARNFDDYKELLDAAAEANEVGTRFDPFPRGDLIFDELDTLVDGNTQYIVSADSDEPPTPEFVANAKAIWTDFQRAVAEYGLEPVDFQKNPEIPGMFDSKLTPAGRGKLNAMRQREITEEDAQEYAFAAQAQWGPREDSDYRVNDKHEIEIIASKTNDQVLTDPDKSISSRWHGFAKYLEIKHGGGDDSNIRADPKYSIGITAKQLFSGALFTVRGMSGTLLTATEKTPRGVENYLAEKFGTGPIAKVERFFTSRLTRPEDRHFANRDEKHAHMAKVLFDGDFGKDRKTGKPIWTPGAFVTNSEGKLEQRGAPQLAVALDNADAGRLAAALEQEAEARGVTVEFELVDAAWMASHGGEEKAHEELLKIFDRGGGLGKIIIANKVAGRGVDIVPVDKAIDIRETLSSSGVDLGFVGDAEIIGGLQVRKSGGPAYSIRVNDQIDARAARSGNPDLGRENGGTPGSATTYVSPEDYLSTAPNPRVKTLIIKHRKTAAAHTAAESAHRAAESAHDPQLDRTTASLEQATAALEEATSQLRQFATPWQMAAVENQLLTVDGAPPHKVSRPVREFGSHRNGGEGLNNTLAVPKELVDWLTEEAVRLVQDGDEPDEAFRAEVGRELTRRLLSSDWKRLLTESGMPLRVSYKGQWKPVSLRLSLRFLDVADDVNGAVMGIQRWAYGALETPDTGGNTNYRASSWALSHVTDMLRGVWKSTTLTPQLNTVVNQLGYNVLLSVVNQAIIKVRSKGPSTLVDYDGLWQGRRTGGAWTDLTTGKPRHPMQVWQPDYAVYGGELPVADPKNPATVPAPMNRLRTELPLHGPIGIPNADNLHEDILTAFDDHFADLSTDSRDQLEEFFTEGNIRSLIPLMWGGWAATPTLYTSSGEAIGYLRLRIADMVGGDTPTGHTMTNSVLESYVLRMLRMQTNSTILNALGGGATLPFGLGSGETDSATGIAPRGGTIGPTGTVTSQSSNTLGTGGNAGTAHSLRLAQSKEGALNVTPHAVFRAQLVRPNGLPAEPAQNTNLTGDQGYPVEMMVPSLEALGSAVDGKEVRTLFLPPSILHMRQLGLETTPLEVDGLQPLIDGLRTWLDEHGFLPSDRRPGLLDKLTQAAVDEDRLNNRRKLDELEGLLAQRAMVDEMIEDGAPVWFQLRTKTGLQRVGANFTTRRDYRNSERPHEGVVHERMLAGIQTMPYTHTVTNGDQQASTTPFALNAGLSGTGTNLANSTGGTWLQSLGGSAVATSQKPTTDDHGSVTAEEIYLFSPGSNGTGTFRVPLIHTMKLSHSHGRAPPPRTNAGFVRMAVPTYHLTEKPTEAPIPTAVRPRDLTAEDSNRLAQKFGRTPGGQRVTIAQGVLQLPETARPLRVAGSKEIKQLILDLIEAAGTNPADVGRTSSPGNAGASGDFVIQMPAEPEQAVVRNRRGPVDEEHELPLYHQPRVRRTAPENSSVAGYLSAVGKRLAGTSAGRWVGRKAFGESIAKPESLGHQALHTAVSTHHLLSRAALFLRDTYRIPINTYGSTDGIEPDGIEAVAEISSYITDVEVQPEPPTMDGENWLETSDLSSHGEGDQKGYQLNFPSLTFYRGKTTDHAGIGNLGYQRQSAHTDSSAAADNTDILRVTSDYGGRVSWFTGKIVHVVTVRTGHRNAVTGVMDVGHHEATHVLEIPNGVEFLLQHNDLKDHPDLLELVRNSTAGNALGGKGGEIADAAPLDRVLPRTFRETHDLGLGSAVQVDLEGGRDALYNRALGLIEKFVPGVTTPGTPNYLATVAPRLTEHTTTLALRTLVNHGRDGSVGFSVETRSLLAPGTIEVEFSAVPDDTKLDAVRGRQDDASTTTLDTVSTHATGDGSSARQGPRKNDAITAVLRALLGKSRTLPGATSVSRTDSGNDQFTIGPGGQLSAQQRLALTIAFKNVLAKSDTLNSTRDQRTWNSGNNTTTFPNVPYKYTVTVTWKPAAGVNSALLMYFLVRSTIGAFGVAARAVELLPTILLLLLVGYRLLLLAQGHGLIRTPGSWRTTESLDGSVDLRFHTTETQHEREATPRALPSIRPRMFSASDSPTGVVALPATLEARISVPAKVPTRPFQIQHFGGAEQLAAALRAAGLRGRTPIGRSSEALYAQLNTVVRHNDFTVVLPAAAARFLSFLPSGSAPDSLFARTPKGDVSLKISLHDLVIDSTSVTIAGHGFEVSTDGSQSTVDTAVGPTVSGTLRSSMTADNNTTGSMTAALLGEQGDRGQRGDVTTYRRELLRVGPAKDKAAITGMASNLHRGLARVDVRGPGGNFTVIAQIELRSTEDLTGKDKATKDKADTNDTTETEDVAKPKADNVSEQDEGKVNAANAIAPATDNDFLSPPSDPITDLETALADWIAEADRLGIGPGHDVLSQGEIKDYSTYGGVFVETRFSTGNPAVDRPRWLSAPPDRDCMFHLLHAIVFPDAHFTGEALARRIQGLRIGITNEMHAQSEALSTYGVTAEDINSLRNIGNYEHNLAADHVLHTAAKLFDQPLTAYAVTDQGISTSLFSGVTDERAPVPVLNDHEHYYLAVPAPTPMAEATTPNPHSTTTIAESSSPA
ncbi:hypothetical protein, partial [Nocardia alni]|uniref:hypothetical protein n=1 Tax=Nocardia alni TaxID=2815723 RepID=UPI001C2270D9